MKNMIFDTSAEMTDIYDLLLRLGVTANYIGFFHTAFAVHLAIQEPERLLLVTKCLYPEVAGQYQTNWSCVERNIRMIAEIAWNRGRPFLEELARHPLMDRPKASEFLAIWLPIFCPASMVIHEIGKRRGRHPF